MLKIRFELFLQFVKADFKLRYKNSVLGFLWVILKPLITFSITYTIFGTLFQTDSNYKYNLMLGLILMFYFSEIIMMGISSLKNRSHIMLKVKFPKEIALFSSITVAFIDFIVNMIVFSAFMYFGHMSISFTGVLLFIFSLLNLSLFGLSISFFSSIIYVKFRDLLNITELSLQILYWATPIYYSITILPERIRRFIELNPLTPIITDARIGLIVGGVNSQMFERQLMVFGILIIFSILGLIFFRRNIKKIAESF